MRMKAILILTGMAAQIGAAGCSLPCASTGYHFEIGKPSTVFSPALTQLQPGQLSVNPLGTTLPPVIEGGPLANATALRGTGNPPGLGRMRSAPAADCTLEEICLALRRIEMRLSQPAGQPIPLPMPKGAPSE